MSEANYVNGAGGSISTSVFVVTDVTLPKAVNQAADATHFIVGVSAEYAATAPIDGASTVAADSAGDALKVYQIGDICLLQATSAGWTAGDRLTSNGSGLGITGSGTQYVGALALTTMTAAGLGQVQVINGRF